MRKADNLPPSCAVVTKSGNLNFLETSGPVQACRYTTTCFGPICWPSSGCNLTYRAAVQDVWGVFFRVLVIGLGGKRGERYIVVSIVGTMT